MNSIIVSINSTSIDILEAPAIMLAHRISQHSVRQRKAVHSLRPKSPYEALNQSKANKDPVLAKQPTLPRFTPPVANAANRLRPQARYVLSRGEKRLLPHIICRTVSLRPQPCRHAASDAANTVFSRHVAFQPSATEPHAQTQPAKPSEAYAILAAQRLNRPISPHLTVYKPQITWYGSALNRITGSVLSGGIYVFATAYLVSPLLGWHLESGAVAEWFGSFGAVTKGVMKFGISWPFTYHFWNGIRHLAWDTGRQLNNKQVQVTGWAVVGLSVVCSAVLAFVGTGGSKNTGKGVGDEGWKSEFKNWKG